MFNSARTGWLLILAAAFPAGCSTPRDSGDPQEEPTCLASADCSQGEYCHLGLCTPGEAPDPDPDPTCQCTGLQTCDDQGSCVPPAICVQDLDCAAPQVCIGGTCTEAPACRVNADCGDGAACFTAFGECGADVCATDGDCPEALRCHGLGFCAACAGDGDCPGTMVCSGGACFEGAACTTHSDCERGRVCGAGGACEDPACTADAYEPNDDLDTATVLDAGTVSIALCQFEVDTFFVPVALGDGLLARAVYSDALGQLRVIAYDAEGNELDAGGGVDQDGHLVFALEQAPTAGIYLELGVDPGLLVPVELTVATVPGGLCVNDAFEPNDDAARAVDAGTNPTAANVTTRLCPGDQDWFTVAIGDGLSLEVVVSTQSGVSPVVDLLGSDGTTLLLRDGSSASPRVLTVRNESGSLARYYLRVHPPAGEVEPSSASLSLRAQ